MNNYLTNSLQQWVITPEERQNYDQRFDLMKPINGFVTGNQTLNLFLQSKLPTQILSKIW